LAAAPAPAPNFDLTQPWRLAPAVALRPEAFGALAYHYGNRRLVFLKSPELVALVEALEHYDSAQAAIEDRIAAPQAASYQAALASLAASEVLVVR